MQVSPRVATHVLRLVIGLDHRGHCLYCYYYYTSPQLFTALHLKLVVLFDAIIVGYLETSKKGNSKMKARHIKNRRIICDTVDGHKRLVTILSIHDDRLHQQTRRTRKSSAWRKVVQKPINVSNYNTRGRH